MTLPSLTSMRVFAALCVAVHHTRHVWAHFSVTDWLGQVGWLGVPFFFILSGFVLMWGYDTRRGMGDFFIRRIVRIYPLHLATLVFVLLCYFSFGRPLPGNVGNLVGTLASFFLLHGWVPGHPEIRQAWNGV